ncbi:hypothetical protein [Flavisolibacter ginsengisoli]|uniref:Uncharacterized protein n=1 Tax=Flavisolibacter ginsengisoli DSM 18119 TaxID=1121884 RepID=A0A1M4ST04_9BACT|nr:hypothetical protein [Flavisolibacter ginsengisoli]SHE35360.1 hypothetical protein SAMN02745131_00222 [Flavisolibacter ginsengisoli DSM 18119]
MKKNLTNNRTVGKTRAVLTYRYMGTLSLLLLLFSCTTAKLSVPEKFSTQATRMPVKGINGWQVGQKLSFGTYTTSTIKRGWDFSSSLQYTKFRIRPEEAVLKVFDISTDNNINKQRSKFQYSISDGNNIAEVFATEKFSEKQLVYKSNNPWIGNASKTKKYDYAFTAAILPVEKDAEPWSLVLVNSYDINKDTAHGIFDRPYVEEEGYATNGKDNIAIRPLRIEKLTTKSGRQTRVFGGKMLSGYELQWDGGVVAIIDILDNNLWIYNDLEPKEKMILSAISSAILLKKMQDVEKDRDQLDK